MQLVHSHIYSPLYTDTVYQSIVWCLPLASPIPLHYTHLIHGYSTYICHCEQYMAVAIHKESMVRPKKLHSQHWCTVFIHLRWVPWTRRHHSKQWYTVSMCDGLHVYEVSTAKPYHATRKLHSQLEMYIEYTLPHTEGSVRRGLDLTRTMKMPSVPEMF